MLIHQILTNTSINRNIQRETIQKNKNKQKTIYLTNNFSVRVFLQGAVTLHANDIIRDESNFFNFNSFCFVIFFFV